MTVNDAMSVENRAKIEAINYLEDPSKDMNSLSKYPLVAISDFSPVINLFYAEYSWGTYEY